MRVLQGGLAKEKRHLEEKAEKKQKKKEKKARMKEVRKERERRFLEHTWKININKIIEAKNMDVFENHKDRRCRELHERMLEAVRMKKRRGYLKKR